MKYDLSIVLKERDGITIVKADSLGTKSMTLGNALSLILVAQGNAQKISGTIGHMRAWMLSQKYFDGPEECEIDPTDYKALEDILTSDPAGLGSVICGQALMLLSEQKRETKEERKKKK